MERPLDLVDALLCGRRDFGAVDRWMACPDLLSLIGSRAIGSITFCSLSAPR
jgi:hypothetical protein